MIQLYSIFFPCWTGHYPFKLHLLCFISTLKPNPDNCVIVYSGLYNTISLWCLTQFWHHIDFCVADVATNGPYQRVQIGGSQSYFILNYFAKSYFILNFLPSYLTNMVIKVFRSNHTSYLIFGPNHTSYLFSYPNHT